MSQNNSPITVSFPSPTVSRTRIVRTVTQTGRAKHMTKPHLKLVTPSIVNRTVTPKRLPNADLRTREHLTEAEVERLMDAARKNRWGHRDATMFWSPTVTAFGPPSLLTCDGIRSSSPRRRCTSAGSSGARPAPTRSSATSYAPCGASSASRSPNRLRVHVGAGRAIHNRWLRPHGRAGGVEAGLGLQGAPPHAQACLRLRSRQ